jgi:hypothetical protein
MSLMAPAREEPRGHADGDLFAALDDGEGEDSVDADGGKEECDCSEAGDEAQGEKALAERSLNIGLHEFALLIVLAASC